MRPLRHAVVRALLALLALLTAVSPAAAAVGEGTLAAHAGRSPIAVHVEDARRAGCPYVHTEDCLVCATIGAHALPGTTGTAVDVATVVAGPAAALPEATTRPAAGRRNTRQARGPPTG